MATARCTNIGEATSSLIGRDAALDELGAATRAHRLVTIVGSAGVGKTRLAEELGRRELARYPGGSWLCDLTAAEDGADLCSAVAATFDVPLLGGGGLEDATRQLARALDARGPVLVILDNLEQLLPHAAPLLAAWHVGARAARFVVTSRRALRIAGEALFDLLPLRFDGDGGDPGASPAAQLFVERARAEVRGFAAGAAERRDVAEIVARLDGLPFAIELAAVRLRVLGTHELAARLRDGFDVLGSARRSGRGDTLEGAIAASWDLLDDAERRALAQASVFRGGFTLDAASSVLCASSAQGVHAALELVQALVDHSLLHPTVAPEGGRRFKMLESVRVFAAARLDSSGDRAATEARHASYFLEFGATAAAKAIDPGRARVRDSIEREAENLFAVVQRAQAGQGRGSAEVALKASLIVDSLLATRGPVARRLSAARAAVAKADAEGVVGPDLARVMLAASAAALDLGDADGSAAALQNACRIAGESPSRELEGAIVSAFATQALHEGRVDEARAGFESALELHAAASDARAEGLSHARLGEACARLGDVDRARACYTAALAKLRLAGDRFAEAQTLTSLGELELDLGLVGAARARSDEALSLHRSIGDRPGEARALVLEAALALEEVRVDVARGALARAGGVYAELGDAAGGAVVAGLLGLADELSDDGDGAARRYDEAIAAHDRGGRALHAALTRCWRARLAARSGDAAAAYETLLVAEQLLAGAGGATWEHVAEVTRAEIAMSEGALAEAEGLLRPRRGSSHADGSPEGRSTEVRRASRMATARLCELVDASRGTAAAAAPARRVEAPAGNVEPPAGADDVKAAPSAAALAGDELVVAATGRWYRPPGGEAVSLRTRKAMRLLVKALADLREASPGEAVSWERLLEAGWPGERVHPTSGAGRVYAAVAALRREGLRDVLVRRDDGYLFDPGVPLARGDDADPRGAHKKA